MDKTDWPRENYAFWDMVSSPLFPSGGAYVRVSFWEGGDMPDIPTLDIAVGSLVNPGENEVNIGLVNEYGGFVPSEIVLEMSLEDQSLFLTDVVNSFRTETSS